MNCHVCVIYPIILSLKILISADVTDIRHVCLLVTNRDLLPLRTIVTTVCYCTDFACTGKMSDISQLLTSLNLKSTAPN